MNTALKQQVQELTADHRALSESGRLWLAVPPVNGIGGDLAVEEGEGPRAVVDLQVAAEPDPPR